MRQGIANLPLHTGRAPRWLFQRMTRLAGSLTEVLAMEFGPSGVLARLSDPFWFQSRGCVLGFDWHSSGLTTTTCGALKEGLRGKEHALGLFIAGGKGAASRRTPDEIRRFSERAGKDGIPYPVDRATYDRTAAVLERAIREAQLGRDDKLQALRRLEKRLQEAPAPRESAAP